MSSPICSQLDSLLVSFKVARVVKGLLVEGRDDFLGDLIRMVAAPVIASGRPCWDGDGRRFAPLITSLPPGVFVESFKLVTPVSTLSCRAQVALLLSSSRLSILTVVSIRLCK